MCSPMVRPGTQSHPMVVAIGWLAAARLGLSVSARTAAPNRLKRLTREAFRQPQHLRPGSDMVVSSAPPWLAAAVTRNATCSGLPKSGYCLMKMLVLAPLRAYQTLLRPALPPAVFTRAARARGRSAWCLRRSARPGLDGKRSGAPSALSGGLDRSRTLTSRHGQNLSLLFRCLSWFMPFWFGFIEKRLNPLPTARRRRGIGDSDRDASTTTNGLDNNNKRLN